MSEDLKSNKKVKTLWEGNLPLDNIYWNTTTYLEYKVSKNLELLKKAHWKHYIQKYPKDYDGHLLFLNYFDQTSKGLRLDIGFIRFSLANFIEQKHHSLTRGHGVIAVQAIVYSPCGNYILIGKRSLSQEYYPGMMTLPGGLLETADKKYLPKIAFMREIREEVHLPLSPVVQLNAILVESNKVFLVFILEVRVDGSKKVNLREPVESDEAEWEGRLNWISLQELKDIPAATCLEGLNYFRSVS